MTFSAVYYSSTIGNTTNPKKAEEVEKGGVLDIWTTPVIAQLQKVGTPVITICQQGVERHSQDGLKVWTGVVTGAQYQEVIPGYFRHYVAVDPCLSDVCHCCGTPNSFKKGDTWISFRNGWDCCHCGGV